MATRILVKCRSQQIPADPGQRESTMLNIICQHQWKRNYDKSQDRVRSTGPCESDNQRCFFVLDNGSVESCNPAVHLYQWNGKQMITLGHSQPILNILKTYAFDPSKIERGNTDEEYREKFGEEALQTLVETRTNARLAMGQQLLPWEEEFLHNNTSIVEH